MHTYLSFKQQNKAILPDQFHQDDVRYTDDFGKDTSAGSRKIILTTSSFASKLTDSIKLL